MDVNFLIFSSGRNRVSGTPNRRTGIVLRVWKKLNYVYKMSHTWRVNWIHRCDDQTSFDGTQRGHGKLRDIRQKQGQHLTWRHASFFQRSSKPLARHSRLVVRVFPIGEPAHLNTLNNNFNNIKWTPLLHCYSYTYTPFFCRNLTGNLVAQFYRGWYFDCKTGGGNTFEMHIIHGIFLHYNTMPL